MYEVQAEFKGTLEFYVLQSLSGSMQAKDKKIRALSYSVRSASK